MRVFCPSCSEPINIADDLAGKSTNCPLCKAAFTAPPLFSATATTPLSAHATNSPVSSDPASSVSPIPPPPAPLPPLPRSGDLNESPAAAPRSMRSLGFSISPEVVQWIAPVCLVLVVIIALFFSWNGAYPGGHGAYTQGAFKSLFGMINIDSVGEKVLKMNPSKPAEGQIRLEDEVHSNWLMLLYLPLLFGAAALAVASTLLPRLPVSIPPNVQPLLPWRHLIVAGLAVLLTLLLAVQASRGFGLERALNNRAAAIAAKEMPADIPADTDRPTADEAKRAEIAEAMYRGKYGIRQTAALDLVFILQVIAALAAAGTFLTNRVSDRRLSRLELSW